MSGADAEELLAQARRLDAEAIHAGEESAAGRELRARAAALRVELVGERVYPVVVCSLCFRLTGWTTAAGQCDICARHAARQAAEAASGWPVAVGWPQPAAPPRAARGRGLSARLRRGESRDQSVVRAWMHYVEPGDTGPVEPEQGYELEVATRDEIERIDGSGILVRFTTLTHRFGRSGWERQQSTRIGRSLLPNPAEFGAELPIASLVEAWGDYQHAVAVINRRSWSEQSAAREARSATLASRTQALREQEHTSELLQE
jgi:hypothetical protein